MRNKDTQLKFMFALVVLSTICTIIWVVNYERKPQSVVETIVKEPAITDCRQFPVNYDRALCMANESCKSGGGKLKSFKDTFGNDPEFECDYDN